MLRSRPKQVPTERVSERRRGMTLVELLIVISIFVILAAVLLPTMKNLLKDRKGNQAAIQVRSFLVAAQARAIGRGREVAVVLERNTKYGDSDINRNAVTRLSLAEVLPPYRGDLENSTVALGSSTVVPYNTGHVNLAVFDLSQNPTASYFLNVGDRIAFDDRPERYEIVNVATSGTVASVTFWNQPYNYSYVGTNRQSTSPRSAVVPLIAGAHKFRIYSRPRRMFSKPLDLPKGTCIDLSVSGVGQAGYDFAADALGDNVGGALDYFKPIYLVFNPNGALSTVYANSLDVTDTTFPFNHLATFERFMPNGSIYLLVGKIDQVTRVHYERELQSKVDNETFVPNLADFSSYWVKIAPDSGQIALSSNLDARDALPLRKSDPAPGPYLWETLPYSRGLSTIAAEISAR
jgi:prepilin-type N-terminal cleavage/methylation domain-containing protein